MAAPSRSSRNSAIQYVQIDGLVVMKIVKHCQEESTGSNDLVQGVLLGLVVDSAQEKVLEITNCFPFPRHNDDDPEFDEVQYQMEMMRNHRHVNIDHLHVGWYQSTYLGSFINRALLESQFNYQHSIEESVVLIYDPEKTSQGHLGLKAYRLSDEMMKLYVDGDFSPEIIAKTNMSYSRLFTEVPIVLRNSHLTNVLLCELEEKDQTSQSNQFLDLSTQNYLEKNCKLLMSCVDDLTQDCNKYINFMRQQAKQNQAKQQYLQKRQIENDARKAKGEPLLPEEDINKVFKPIPPPARLDALLTSSQIDTYAQQINEFASQSFGKLFMAECLQEPDSTLPNA